MRDKLPGCGCLVLPCQTFSGISMFYLQGENHVGGSLSELHDHEIKWYKERVATMVPTLSMKQLLEAIPDDITIDYMKTDMQGWDLVSLKSAGTVLRRVKTLMCETYQPGYIAYDNCPDNMIESYKQYMPTVGFKLTDHRPDQWGEGDSFWERVD